MRTNTTATTTAAKHTDQNDRNNSLIGKKSIDISYSLPYKTILDDKNKDKKEKLKEDDSTKQEKKKYTFYKYSEGIPLAESILINNIPMFLQVENGKPILNYNIELDYQILVPPDKTCYLSKEYNFSSVNEIERYIKRAEKETLDSLFKKVKYSWKKYFDIDNETLTLCAADTILTYFQDKLGMTHYLLFVGDNNTGKSNALRIFHHLGYRSLFDTSITTANIYNFLGMNEEGQGIILEDEIDDIENQEDKMRIYKVGYVAGAKVTRIYESNGSKSGSQKSYNTFCFKAFSSEKQPSFKAKGFSDRIFTIKCSPGTPQYDISEVINDAGDSKHKKLYREINDLRKLLLVYRIIHYNDNIPDLKLSIGKRDKQLCKPVIRLFNNTSVINEIVTALSRFLAGKNNKKLNSFDSYLYSTISDLVKDENTAISNEYLWSMICSIPGSPNQNNPYSYQTDDFGTISKTMITRICEDKFGAQKGHDGQKRSLVFNKTVIKNLKDNYSPAKKLKF